MLANSEIETPQAIVSLGPYPCYQIGKVRQWQDSNWLRRAFDEGQTDRAYLVLPPYIKKDDPLREELHERVMEIEDNLNIVDSISQLPDRDSLGEVIVVVDAAFFSNQQTPRFTPDELHLLFSVGWAVRALKEMNLRISAIIYNTSPSYPHANHASIIQEWLLYYLSRNGENE